MIKVIIVGAGQNGSVVQSILSRSSIYSVEGFFDDGDIKDKKILGKVSDYIKFINDYHFFISPTNNQFRKKTYLEFKEHGARFVNAIHESAFIESGVRLGENVMIGAFSYVNIRTSVGDNTIINNGCNIEHDNTIGSHCHLAPRVSTSGEVVIKDDVFIGTGAIMKNKITINEGGFIGCGSNIIEDTLAYSKYFGNPARFVKTLQSEGQKTIPLSLPWFDEQEAKAAYDVVRGNWLISGPSVEKFEEEFAKKVQAQYAVAVNSGSSALLIAQQALGIGRDDEVIVPDMTFVSTASSSMYLGAKPVFADIDLSAYCLEAKDIEKRITPKTKAIIPVHYAGQSADMDAILEIARKYNLKVLEDAAEAHLTKYKDRFVGTIGDIGIFSFTPSKPMTTGEGGMIVTNNQELAKKCKMIRNFCDLSKFEYSELGFNFRMPEVMGAIGLIQLNKLDEAVLKRQRIAEKYTQSLKDLSGIITPFVRKDGVMNFQLYTIRLDLDKLLIGRDGFIAELSEKGIQGRLYYPCLHRQEIFRKIREYDDGDFPNSLLFSATALSLPIYPALGEDEQDYVIKSIKEIIIKFRK